jgi:hypothetical protein
MENHGEIHSPVLSFEPYNFCTAVRYRKQADGNLHARNSSGHSQVSPDNIPGSGR